MGRLGRKYLRKYTLGIITYLSKALIQGLSSRRKTKFLHTPNRTHSRLSHLWLQGLSSIDLGHSTSQDISLVYLLKGTSKLLTRRFLMTALYRPRRTGQTLSYQAVFRGDEGEMYFSLSILEYILEVDSITRIFKIELYLC